MDTAMMHEADDFPDTEIQEMTFPIEAGYSLYVLRKFCDTDDEKFLCTLYDPKGKIVPMNDPVDECQDFEVDTVKAYGYHSVMEIMEDAGRVVDRLIGTTCPCCKRAY